MNIDEMNIKQIEERLATIAAELDTYEGDKLEEIRQEVENLNAKKKELVELEQRQAAAKALESGAAVGKTIESRKEVENPMEEKKIFTVESPEYRDAFYAMIAGTATEEQREIVVDSTQPGNGDAIAIPKTLDEKIWDGIHTAHPILADITTVRSGVSLEVTRHTAIATRTTKKLDSAETAAEESNTFVKVVLYGYDYEKYVTLTYAEAKMSQGALEDYLAEEIAAELGEALAKDVFAQILSDAGTGQKVTPAATPDLFSDLKKALALATMGGQKVIYAPASSYYEIVGAIKQGSPFNMAATLGVEVKLDDAATKVTVVAPKSFILNEVQSVMVESDRDIVAHKVIVSGYMRAQGTLRQTKAAAYIG